VTFKEYYS